MQFAEPHLLFLFFAVVLLGGFIIMMFLRRKRLVEKFAEAHLLQGLADSFSERRLYIKYILLVFVFIFAVLALARPQWGFKWQDIKRQGIDILVLIDTSKSMLTQDVKPNRLERTKLAVRDLLKELKGDRVGLIAFAGDAYLMCPLTRDYNGFMLSLTDLDTNSVSRGGTNITRAIKKAMESYEEIPNQFKAVILVTDGDNLEDDPVSMAKEAKQKGIKIYTVGVGTAEGELIQVEDRQGQKTFIKDDKGNFVKSRLNERLLQEIALITEGGYLKASGAEFGLDLIYEKELSKMEKRQFESGREKKYHERFQWPLAAAVILLVVESCLTTRKQ